jgi:hypothetical protein
LHGFRPKYVLDSQGADKLAAIRHQDVSGVASADFSPHYGKKPLFMA